jgi:16S rRNA (cytosine1402-N4)-methyltransferase
MNGTENGPRTPAQRHVPVMAGRVTDLLEPALARPDGDLPDPVVVDATLGMGGHAELLLQRCSQARLIGLDRDPRALELARERLAGFGDRFTAVHAVYDELPDVLDELDIQAIQGILFDLGVSSMQLDETERGFSYSREAPLDMRMDPTRGVTAADVVNTYTVADLTRIFSKYGEERHSRRIAQAIVRERDSRPLTTSTQLADLVREVVPVRAQERSGHPAKRIFQALRIEVNGELVVLERALPAAIDALDVGGRIVVLAYHSLEDRLVKQTFARLARPDVPDGVPVVPAGYEAVLAQLTRGAEKPEATENETNPRAASARLRAAERIRTTTRRGRE